MRYDQREFFRAYALTYSKFDAAQCLRVSGKGLGRYPVDPVLRGVYANAKRLAPRTKKGRSG